MLRNEAETSQLAEAPASPQAAGVSVLRRKPWILIVLLLGVFIAAWISFLLVAYRNMPPAIEPARAGSSAPSTRSDN